MAECEGHGPHSATAEIVGKVRKSGRTVRDAAGKLLCPIEVTAGTEVIHVVGEGADMTEQLSALAVGAEVTICGDLRVHTWTTAGGHERVAVHVLARTVDAG